MRRIAGKRSIARRRSGRFAIRRRRLIGLLKPADLLAQNRGVVPAEAQLGIGGVAAESLEQLRHAAVVVEEDVPFAILEEGEDVYLSLHGRFHGRRL